MKGEESNQKSRKKMKRKRFSDISTDENEDEEEERRRRRRRRRRKKKMKRKRYCDDIAIEEEEERRRASKKKMKMEGKRKRCYVDIPMDVLVDILSRLPARCVWRLRSVCKDWKSQIESPSFADLQLRQSKEERFFMFSSDEFVSKYHCPITRFYSIDYKYGKAVQVVQEFLHPAEAETKASSINGLVCYYGTDGKIKVCNPVTRQQITLPKPSFLLSSNPDSDLDIGIGFDSTSKTYKVLAISTSDDQQVEIFTLGRTQRWRKLQLPLPKTGLDTSDGVYANGCLFWLTSEYHNIRWGLGDQDGDRLRGLMTFDFGEEKFEFVPLPPDIDTHQGDHLIHEVGGHACLIQTIRKTKRVKMWTLAPNSPTKLWAHHHTLLLRSQHYTCSPGLFPVSSGVIMEFDFFERTKLIFFYNQQGRAVKSIKVRGVPRRFSPSQLHTESLVSLTSILAANL